MHASMHCRLLPPGWATLALLAAALSPLPAAAADDAVYQRDLPEGAISLTNVPDGAGYTRVLTAPRVAAGGAGSTVTAGGAVPPAPAVVGTARDLTAQPPTAFQASLPDREAIHEAAAAAAHTAGLSPDQTHAMGSHVASQALQDTAAAGGVADRLRNMYQATQAATIGQHGAAR